MAERRSEPTLGPADSGPPLAAEPPPWRGEERSGRLWWWLLVLLILAGLGWYLWDKGYVEKARQAIFGGPPPAAAPGGISSNDAMELEALLAAMDLDPGPADGTLDAKTAAAIRTFQEMAGLPADGKATPALLAEVRAVAQQLGIVVKSGS